MLDPYLEKLFAHNNWANQQIIQACAGLSDAQLDTEPQSATKGTIRRTLYHMVASQQGYLNLLMMPVETRPTVEVNSFDQLRQAANASGDGLLEFIHSGTVYALQGRLQTRDGWYVEPWVVVLQIINHATEHREQIKSMLTALGVTPPEIDGWDYGMYTKEMVPVTEKQED